MKHRLPTTLVSPLIYRNANPEISQFMQINSPEGNEIVCLSKKWIKPGVISRAIIPPGTQFWWFVKRENCLFPIMINTPIETHIIIILSYSEVFSGIYPGAKSTSGRSKTKRHLRAATSSPWFPLPLDQSFKDQGESIVFHKSKETDKGSMEWLNQSWK